MHLTYTWVGGEEQSCVRQSLYPFAAHLQHNDKILPVHVFTHQQPWGALGLSRKRKLASRLYHHGAEASQPALLCRLKWKQPGPVDDCQSRSDARCRQGQPVTRPATQSPSVSTLLLPPMGRSCLNRRSTRLGGLHGDGASPAHDNERKARHTKDGSVQSHKGRGVSEHDDSGPTAQHRVRIRTLTTTLRGSTGEPNTSSLQPLSGCGTEGTNDIHDLAGRGKAY